MHKKKKQRHINSETFAYGKCTSTYHKSTDAPLRRVPFEAAVDVAARVDQEHDAAPNSVEVTQQQLKRGRKKTTKNKSPAEFNR